jgi:hypothetical protein
METGIESYEIEPIHIVDEWEKRHFGRLVYFAIAFHDEIPGVLGMWQEYGSETPHRKIFGGDMPEREDVEASYFEWRATRVEKG